MADLLITAARLPDGRLSDILVRAGMIAAIEPKIHAPDLPQLEAQGQLVTPPFVDAHFHLDAALSYGTPRINESGTLLEGIALWGELRAEQTAEELKKRARTLCAWAVAQGICAIRSHVDVSGPSLMAAEVLCELRAEFKPDLDLQLVAFPQDGLLRSACQERLIQALDLGFDVIGGIPHFERSAAAAAQSIAWLCRLAAERGLPVDLHCDETDDPNSRHIETLAEQACAFGLQGRVAGSHLTSLASMNGNYRAKLSALLQEAQVAVIANPLINITLQGRYDDYPKRRGLAPIKELIADGLTVAFGHDCVLDPWYALGRHDMIEVAHMALHVAQMTAPREMNLCWDAITTKAAQAIGLKDYGLEKGKRGDFVILQCADPIAALRLKPTRLFVIRGGKIIAQTPPVHSQLNLASGQQTTDFAFPLKS